MSNKETYGLPPELEAQLARIEREANMYEPARLYESPAPEAAELLPLDKLIHLREHRLRSEHKRQQRYMARARQMALITMLSSVFLIIAAILCGEYGYDVIFAISLGVGSIGLGFGAVVAYRANQSLQELQDLS